MTLQFSTALRNAILDARETSVGTSPVIKFRTGNKPGITASDTGTVLATLTLPSDWMAAASAGSKAKSGTWEDLLADASGTVGHCRLYKSDGTTVQAEWNVGATGSGKAMEVDDDTFTAGESVTVTTFTLSALNAGAATAASLIYWADSVINAELDAIESTIGTSAVLKTRTGAGPGIGNADSGTVVSVHNLPSDWMAAAIGGEKARTGAWKGLVLVDATVEHFRVYASDGTTQHIEGTITDLNGGGDIEFVQNGASPTNLVTTGQLINITTFNLYPYVEPPVQSDNLLLNPSFTLPGPLTSYFNLQYWIDIFGTENPQTGPWYSRYGAHGNPYSEAQFDHDDTQSWSWDVGDINSLHQDVESDRTHVQVYFYYGAIQHDIEISVFTIKIYGTNDDPPPEDSLDWDAVVMTLDQDDILAEVPRATSSSDYYFNEHVADSPNYTFYRLEFYGEYLDESSALKFHSLELRVREESE